MISQRGVLVSAWKININRCKIYNINRGENLRKCCKNYNNNGKGYFNTMKVRASVKKISPDDIIVRRKGVLRVINKKKPKNKQRQG